MSLALLAARWCAARGHSFTALIVDHGLRASSGAEARMVAARLEALGIAVEILEWVGAKPASGIQQVAREARLGLLIARAGALGAYALLLAHHLGDQAETLVMRLGRGSGPDGLAAIRAKQRRDGVTLLRPLLPVPPAILRTVCLEAAMPWIEDPSNRDRRFERVRVRQASTELAAAGLSPAPLGRMAAAFGRLRDWSDRWLAGFLSENGQLTPMGYARIDLAAAIALPQPLRTKFFSGMLQSVGGGLYPPRGEAVARFEHWLCGAAGRRMTIGGCLVWRMPDGMLWIARETARSGAPRPAPAQPSQLWDGRFMIQWRGVRPGWVHMLQRSGDHRLKRLGGYDAVAANLPQSVRTALPAVTDLDGRLFAPHFPESRAESSCSQDNPLQIEFHPVVSWVAEALRSCGDDSGAMKD